MIDPKTIEELTALEKELNEPATCGDGKTLDFPRAGEADCCHYHHDKWIEMRAGFSALLSERSELIAEVERHQKGAEDLHARLDKVRVELGLAGGGTGLTEAEEIRRQRSELLALLWGVQIAPLRAQDGRALVTLDLDLLRRIATAIGATPGDATPDPVARNR